MNEAIRLAATVNCPMIDAYEKAIYVSDHAMLINRDAIDRVGVLDDTFSPDLYEDKDFCVRTNTSGMEVLLCFNSYIFKTMDRHKIYGGEEKLTEQNRDRFADKWDCNIDYSNNARTGIIELINADKEKTIEVLELGCAMGSTLNRIKRLWPNAKVHGVEFVDSVARIGGKITDIIQGDVENMVIPYSQKQFDYIICADVLEHLRDPQATIRRFMPFLKDDGFFIISLPHNSHYAVVMMLMLDGRFDYADSGILDATHLKFFTRDTAKEMIESAGLKVLNIQRNYNGHPEDNEFIARLSTVFDVIDPEELKVFQYYFVAEKA
jgi:2-polyprenyl-3-methyl-5-hydroxy-6-metoxy-1,4-benzoquinol methylase